MQNLVVLSSRLVGARKSDGWLGIRIAEHSRKRSWHSLTLAHTQIRGFNLYVSPCLKAMERSGRGENANTCHMTLRL